VQKIIEIDEIDLERPRETRNLEQLRFFVTDSAEKFRRLGSSFLGQRIENITHVDLKE